MPFKNKERYTSLPAELHTVSDLTMQWRALHYYLLSLIHFLILRKTSKPTVVFVMLYLRSHGVKSIAFQPAARGGYILRAQVHSYSNPTNCCAGCGTLQGCCDNYVTFTDQCDENRCDSELFYCVKPLGTPNQTFETLYSTQFLNSLTTV